MDSFKIGDHVVFNNEGPNGVISKNMKGIITEIDDCNKRVTIELDKPIKYFTFSDEYISLVEDENGN